VDLRTVLIGGIIAVVVGAVYGSTDKGSDDPVGQTLLGLLAGLLVVALVR
jgi:hypothetical protein